MPAGTIIQISAKAYVAPLQIFGFIEDRVRQLAKSIFYCVFLLIFGLLRVVDVVVQSAALLALHCLAHNEIAYVDDVAKLAKFAAHDALLE